ncbi:uncharacterized protein LOC129765741 [Toxorhynchites rutilus septentrionalis]|uniref:uncharacterized protein LOC129765741 n=1 Tax=Toxorhynchites rutilus septentrionalis TaxID=329112 RepID=UPI0024784F91|nr:uncharacterized protein LOC129765741 [Toxorhynchites rutilus septentrionalis]
MSSVCHACATDAIDEQVICQGFCNAVFHPKCSGLNIQYMGEILKSKQLFWMCQSCSNLMKDMRLRRSVRSAYETGQEDLLGKHNKIVESLKSEILTELKAEIKLNFTALINSNSLTPKNTYRPALGPTSVRSRRLFGPNNGSTQMKTTLIAGTGGSVSPTLGVSTVPTNNRKFWLYVSRISRNVSAEQVAALAKQRLDNDDIEVVRLVAKGRDLSTLSFGSFKVGMDSELKTKALCTSTWPKGILFREFSDNRINGNFWEPQKTLNQQSHRTTNDAVIEHTISPMQVTVRE